LQGTSEKIHFHRPVRDHSLESADLLAEDEFAGMHLSRIAFVQSIAPVIEQSAVYAEFPRKPENVVARLHSLDRIVPKFLTEPFSLFPFHFAAPLQQSVHYETVSLQGVTPVHE
jgi:hypothetical protein